MSEQLELSDDLETLLQNALGAAFHQGMASQRLETAQEDFQKYAETAGTNILKLHELLNIGPNKKEVQ